MSLFLRTLGLVAVERADGGALPIPKGKPLALLIYAALADAPPSRDELARLFWPEAKPEQGRQSVRNALWLLRKPLGEGVLEEREGTRVRLAGMATDVDRFRAALADDQMEEAEALWRGRFLEHLELPALRDWERWVEEVREDLARRFTQALFLRARAAREAGRLDDSLRWLRRSVEVDPEDVSHRLHLIELLLDLREIGAAADALSVAQRHFRDSESRTTLRFLESRIEAARAHGSGDADSALRRPELVGRVRELSKLRGLWRDAAQGSCGAALVSGSSGIGKTRLADELTAIVLRDDGVVAAAKAFESDQGVEWGFAATLVRKLFSLPGAAGITGTSEMLLRPLVPGVAPERAGAAAPGGGAIQAGPLSEAVLDLIGAVAYETPLLLVLDDFQWIDAASRALVSRVVHALRDQPVLFVITVRPEELGRDAKRALDSIRRDGASASIDLAPLGPAEVRELLGLVVEFTDPEATDRVFAQVFAITRGNPLFLVELLHELREQEVVRLVSGRWVLDVARLPTELGYPRSVREIIARRLDRLGDDAQAVAAKLAARPSSASLRTLRSESGLAEAPFTRAVGELVDRDVVRWEEDRLLFSHDQLREVARHRFRSMAGRTGWRARWRRSAVVAAVASVAIIAGVAVVWGDLLAPGAPRYGGGELFFRLGDSIWVATPPAGVGDEWGVRRYPTDIPVAIVQRVFRLTSGELRWYGERTSVDASPYIVQLFEDGREEEIVRREGDTNVGSPSPDGRFIAYATENPETDRYDTGLWIARADGSAPRRLHQAVERVVQPILWSPDGRSIAAQVFGGRDTLALFSPTGAMLGGYAFEEVMGFDWCAGRLAAAVRETVDPELVLIDPASRSVVRTGAPRPVGQLACSPDGTAVIYRAVIGGEVRTVVHDLAARETSTFPMPRPGAALFLGWVPRSLARVPVSVSIVDGPAELRWGERTRIQARTRFSDGRYVPYRVSWTSSDPTTVSVSPDGVITANRPGTARIAATVDGWIADTLRVHVRGEVRESVLLRDAFATLDRARWQIVGTPPAAIGVHRGEPVLLLTGDGLNGDGVVSRRSFRAAGGVTLELEFRGHFTTADQQRITISLTRGIVRPGTLEGSMDDWIERDNVGFTYPLHELTRFQPHGATFESNGVSRVFRLPDDLPPDDWTHVAIQLRPDGSAALFVNRRFVGNSAVRVGTDEGSSWRVALLGASDGTRVMVRNLTLWSGPRYEP